MPWADGRALVHGSGCDDELGRRFLVRSVLLPYEVLQDGAWLAVLSTCHMNLPAVGPTSTLSRRHARFKHRSCTCPSVVRQRSCHEPGEVSQIPRTLSVSLRLREVRRCRNGGFSGVGETASCASARRCPVRRRRGYGAVDGGRACAESVDWAVSGVSGSVPVQRTAGGGAGGGAPGGAGGWGCVGGGGGGG